MPTFLPEYRNLKPTSGPPLVRMIFMMLVGLLIVMAGVEMHWHKSVTPPHGRLALAEKAFRSGDDHEAVALFGRLAKSGNATAEYWLAHMTELGLGVPRNPAKAIPLYRKAAKQKFVKAEVRLGEIYLDGNLAPPDPKRAKKYLDDGAYSGNAHAAMLLGQIYRDGIGIAADPTKADAWFEVATLEGSTIARRERGVSFHDLSVADRKGVIIRTRDILKTIKSKRKAHASAADSSKKSGDTASKAQPRQSHIS